MNKEHQKTICQLCEEYLQYLQRQSYSQGFIRTRKQDLKHLCAYAEQYNISFYSAEICSEYIETIITDTSKKTKSVKNRHICCANALLEYLSFGITIGRKSRRFYTYTGEVGEYIKQYLEYRMKEKGLKQSTLTSDYLYLERLNIFLTEHGYDVIVKLDATTIMKFTSHCTKYTASTMYSMLASLRRFLSYLCEIKVTATDFSYIIPKTNYKKNAHLPSVYEKEEVMCLLNSVDRGSPMGRRDYAILMLATRLGLRASDISRLKFSHISWEKKLISINQHKTGKYVQLHLLPDVGDAIIDYMKHGRPESDSPFIFLRTQAPHTALNEGSIYNIAKRYFYLAGIKNIDKRKHGSHALRHSLASRLLEMKMPATVIMDALGHESIESTRAYLRIDMESLKQCALKVPPLPAKLYEGGVHNE